MLINDQLHTSQLIVILHIFIINIVLFARVIMKLIKYILQFYLDIFRDHSQKFSINGLCSWRRQIHIM